MTLKIEGETGTEERIRALRETQRAVLNILDDFNTEKNNLEKMQAATFNILEDFNVDRSNYRILKRLYLIFLMI